MPAGEIGAAEVANFSSTHEIIQRAQRFFDGRDGIECMQLKEVDVISAKPFQRTLDRTDQMKPRGANVIRSVPETECGLGGDEYFVASAGDGFAENFLGLPIGINIGAVQTEEQTSEL